MAAPRKRNLKLTRFSRAYQNRLERGWTLVCFWAHCLAIDLNATLCNVDVANEKLESFVQWCYTQHYTYHDVKHALLACQHRYTHLRFRIRSAWDQMCSWSLELSIHNRVPMPLLILRALTITSMMTATACDPTSPDRCKYCIFAVMLQVGFHGLLRPREIFCLKVKHIMATADGVCLVLIDPKNRFAMGRVQHCLIRSLMIREWMLWVIEGLKPDSYIWPFSLAAARSVMQELRRRRGLMGTPFSLASLRAGGATERYMSGVSIPRLLFMGRWRSLSSLSCYIQEAVASLVLAQLDNSKLREFEALISLTSFLERPPPVPWSQLFKRPTEQRQSRTC